MALDGDHTGRRARWALEIDPYNWTVEYRQGPRHGNADSMSRRPPQTEQAVTATVRSQVGYTSVLTQTDEEELLVHPEVHSTRATSQTFPAADVISVVQPVCSDHPRNPAEHLGLPNDGKDIVKAQKEDPVLSVVIDWVSADRRPPFSQLKGQAAALRHFWKDFHKLTIADSLLCRKAPLQNIVTKLPFEKIAADLTEMPITRKDLLLGDPPFRANATPGTPSDYAASLFQRLHAAFDSVADNIAAAGSQQKRYYDRRIRHTPYEPGDMVWVDLPALSRHKLSPKWAGPFKVLRRFDTPTGEVGVDYQILDQLDPRAKPKVVHYNRLKPYISPWSTTNVPSTTVVTPQPLVPWHGPPPVTALSGSRPYCLRGTSIPERPPPPAVMNPALLPAAEMDNVLPPAVGMNNALPPVPVLDSALMPSSLPPVSVSSTADNRTRSGRFIRPPARYRDT
ncbi:hypothetical protein SKAU_G00412210 [Synaphobranchus kaupii]|uniref:Uncharacterized protein n=1 Tax=Synaphobranchus kaupii TaxID=118154 RepID=A0A9Q1IBT0_SYNKA|nr:hypothetical protein SKAU_G00412210 [Synaphobranchus kaupii]